MDVMLDFICMGPVDLQGAVGSDKIQFEKFRSWHVDWSYANEIKHDVHPRCIEREKDNFKRSEINCLKECALV